MTTQNATKTYNANTFIWQGEQEFRCGWDFSGAFDEESAIIQITEILEANAGGEEVFEDDNGEDFNLFGMAPREFETFIIQEEQAAKEMYGTSWVIETGEICE